MATFVVCFAISSDLDQDWHSDSFIKECFWTINFKKGSRWQQKHEKLLSMHRIKDKCEKLKCLKFYSNCHLLFQQEEYESDERRDYGIMGSCLYYKVSWILVFHRISKIGINYSIYINPYKPSIIFIGHRQTVWTKIRHFMMWCLIRIFTVCLQNFLLKFGKGQKIPPNTPKIGNGLTLLIRIGKSFQLKWIKSIFICSEIITYYYIFLSFSSIIYSDQLTF